MRARAGAMRFLPEYSSYVRKSTLTLGILEGTNEGQTDFEVMLSVAGAASCHQRPRLLSAE